MGKKALGFIAVLLAILLFRDYKGSEYTGRRRSKDRGDQ